MRPDRSGTPSPERSSPSANWSGGNVTGIRMTTAFLPAAPSACHSVRPWRLLTANGLLFRDVPTDDDEAPRGERETEDEEDGPPGTAREDLGKQANDEKDDGGRDRPVRRAEEKRLLGFVFDREGRRERLRVALEKVENPCAPRVETGREGRPRNGRLGRDRRQQRRESPLRAQRGEVREPTRRHLLLDERGVDAVEPEDHDATLLRARRGRDERQEENAHRKPRFHGARS